MEVNEPIDLGQLRAEVEEAGAPWEVSYTSMAALEEEERVIRLGVPPSPGVDIETLEEGKELGTGCGEGRLPPRRTLREQRGRGTDLCVVTIREENDGR
jgi:hypothetical protein